MSDYIVSPGADLFVGPHGHLLESMGASSSKPCCSDCASGAKKCGGDALGALPPRVAPPSMLVVGPPAPQTNTGGSLFSSLPIVPLAILGVGGYFIFKMVRGRRARRNPRRRRR